MPEQLNQSVFASTTFKDGVLAVKLAGPSIGQREVPIISDQVVTAIMQFAGGIRWIVLDMSDVTFINSMGLGMCIDFRNRIAKSGGKAALLGMEPQLLELFKMVKVDRLFTILKDHDAAAKAVMT